MNEKITNGILIACIIMTVILAILVCLQTIIQTRENYHAFLNAPNCNTEQLSGICKLNNTSWLVCHKPSGFEADIHLRNTDWCEVVELYDVRT